jgi:hypothetical protein
MLMSGVIEDPLCGWAGVWRGFVKEALGRGFFYLELKPLAGH